MTILELFSGIHGPGHAMRDLDLGPSVGFETNADAAATARLNGFNVIEKDLSLLDPKASVDDEVTGIWASPPCQTYSHLGKLAELEDPRGQLVFEPIRWVRSLMPEWLACEQVQKVLPIWQDMVKDLEDLGYSACAFVMQGEQFGLPQTRTRAMLMASRTRTVNPPEPSFKEHKHPIYKQVESSLPDPTTMREALAAAGLPLKERENWISLGQDIKKGKYLHRSVDLPCPTISTRSASQWILKNEDSVHDYSTHERGINFKPTVDQMKVLQGFPADMPISGNKTSQNRQIGNACPPTMALPILKSLTRK
jgi:DNA (cytosine-5)-methyltransferase 1